MTALPGPGVPASPMRVGGALHGARSRTRCARRGRRRAPRRRCMTSSRLTPRANALSFIFFRTDLASTSCTLRDGLHERGGGDEPRELVHGEQRLRHRRRRAGRCSSSAWPRIASRMSSGQPRARRMRTPSLGMLLGGRVRVVGEALVVEVVDQPREPPALHVLAAAAGVGAHGRLHGEHVLPQGVAGGVLVHEGEGVVSAGQHGSGCAVVMAPARIARGGVAGAAFSMCPRRPIVENIAGDAPAHGGRAPFLREVHRRAPERRHALPLQRAGDPDPRSPVARCAGDLLRRRERLGQVHAARGDRRGGPAARGRQRRPGRRRDAGRAARAGRRAPAGVVAQDAAGLLPAGRGFLRLREAAVGDARASCCSASRELEVEYADRSDYATEAGDGSGGRVAGRHGAPLRRRPGRQLAWPELPAALPVAIRARRPLSAGRARGPAQPAEPARR